MSIRSSKRRCGAWAHLARRTSIPKPYWEYEDLGIFFLVVVLLGPALILCVRLHVIAEAELIRPNPPLQIGVVLFLSAALYTVLKIRHGQPVLVPLGWTAPSPSGGVAALAGGLAMGGIVSTFAELYGGDVLHTASPAMVILATFLGPALEESLFRGCVLPLLSEDCGSIAAIAATALAFAMFHGPATFAQWFFMTATGVAYGAIRVVSGSTLASALTHSAYNASLFLWAKAGH